MLYLCNVQLRRLEMMSSDSGEQWGDDGVGDKLVEGGFRAKGKGRECANGCFVNCTCLVATSNDKVVSMLVDGS